MGVDDPVPRVLERLQGVRPCGADKWEAFCPVHENPPGGHKRSLSIGLGKEGRALLTCQAGCKTADVVQAMDLRMRDLFARNDDGNKTKTLSRRIVATYEYTGAAGNLLYQVVRFEPKGFCQRRPDGEGHWVWGLNSGEYALGKGDDWYAVNGKTPDSAWRMKFPNTPRVLYRLPQLLAAAPNDWVFVVEGEKDVDTLARLGLVATTNPGGAGKWGQLANDLALHSRRVAIIPDQDNPNLKGRIAGRDHGEDVARRLHGKAIEVRIVDLGTIEGFEGKDVTDWAEWRDSQTVEELAAALIGMAEDAPIWTPSGDGCGVLPGPVLTCLADVEPREVEWLWPGRVALGRITLLVGRPGEGKSFLTIDMAARVTTGTPWPDGSTCPMGSVILISAEDDPGDTIRPRLDAHCADVRRVHLLSAVRHIDDKGDPYEVWFTLVDIAALEAALEACPGCRLVVVDPIGSFLGGKTDAHRDNEVRSVLAPIAKLAEKYRAAVVVVAHRRKSSGSSADDLALGSRAFTGIARAVWHLSRDKENKVRRLLLPGKNNLVADGNGLAFTICGDPPVIVWEHDPVTMSADDALAIENGEKHGKPGPEPEAMTQAAEWLRGELADQSTHQVADLKQEAKAAGLNWRSVQRASAHLKVKVSRQGFGGPCTWQLPSATTIQAQDGRNGEPGTNGTNGDSPEETDSIMGQSCHACQDRFLGKDEGQNEASDKKKR